MVDDSGFVIADRSRIEATLDRLARTIHAELGAEVEVVGILRRGAPIARALASRLARLRGDEVQVGEIRLKRYADDLSIVHEDPELEREEPLPFEVEGASVLLVDDVVYSGRTFLKAVTHLSSAGAETIHLCALCSRGPNRVPVHADFVGMQLDVGEEQVIEVHAPPYEEEWSVRLFHREELAESG